MPPPVTVTKSGPGLKDLEARLKQLRRSDVLVGIPAAQRLRKDDTINNAALLWLHSKGSDLQHIPARPVLEPSIAANQKLITPHLGLAAKAVLNKDPIRAEKQLRLAGVIASNGAKRWFSKEHLAPNAPSTIAKKGSDTPLVDQGSMRRAITYVIRMDNR